MSIYSGVFAFAVGIGPYPGGLLAKHFGLPAPFYTFAALGLIAAILAWFRVPETRGMRAGVAVAGTGVPALSFAAQMRILAAQPGFLLICLVSFSTFFARTGALFNVIPVIGEDRLHLGPDQIGLGLGMISVIGLGLAYPSGVLVDRFGRKAVIVPSTTLTGAAMIVFAIAPAYALFLVACAVWAFASGISSAAPGSYAADTAPPGMNAAAMSSYRMLADFGYVAGPLLLGFVADIFGADVALGATAVLLLVVGLLFARFAPETYRSQRSERESLPQPAAAVAGSQER
jgi:MFS family permease